MSRLPTRHIALLLFLAFPLGCASAGRATTDPDTAELEAIQHADPAKALAAALGRGDERFLGVAGYSVTAPGLDEEADQEILYQQGMRVIAGTTDTPADERHSQLIYDARLYAAAYNRLLVWKLSRRAHPRPTTQQTTAK